MIKREIRIIPECYADTALAKFLFSKPGYVNHALSIGEVAVEMEAERNDTVILVGFVDNDKRIPPYFRDFEEIDCGNRVLFKQKEDYSVQHFLVVLDKAIETFLLYNAAQVGINVADFGFSGIQKEFQKSLKSQQIEDSENYQSLLQSLRIQQAPDFVKIEAFLNQFL